MKFSKVREVKSPTRANPEDAGIDFFIPQFNPLFHLAVLEKNKDQPVWIDGVRIRVAAHSRVLIPSGIKVDVPFGFSLVAFNKSGVVTKKGADVGATVIDSGYQGEIHHSFINTTDDDLFFSEGEKIIQYLILPIATDSMVEVDPDDLYLSETARGSKGLGSTGTS